MVRSFPVRSPICFVAQIMFASKTVQRMGDFDRIQVFALDVLDECDFQQAVLGKILNDHRNFGEAGQSCGSPAALAGYQLIAVTCLGARSTAE